MSSLFGMTDAEVESALNNIAEKYDGWMVCGCRCACGEGKEYTGVIPMGCTTLNAMECTCGRKDSYVYRVMSVYGATEKGVFHIDAINAVSESV